MSNHLLTSEIIKLRNGAMFSVKTGFTISIWGNKNHTWGKKNHMIFFAPTMFFLGVKKIIANLIY